MNKWGLGKVIIFTILLTLVLALLAFSLSVYKQYTTIHQTNQSVVDNSNTPTLTNYIPTADDDPRLGSVTAPVQIIAFEDFQCPYCSTSAPIITALLKRYPNQVSFVYRDFPLTSIHPQANEAALAANCALEQGQFWQYHDALFANQSTMSNDKFFLDMAEQLNLETGRFERCVEQAEYQIEIQHDVDSGILAGIRGTPTFFVNGQPFAGVLTLEQWTQIVESIVQ